MAVWPIIPTRSLPVLISISPVNPPLFLLLEVGEFDLDEFMSKEAFVDGPDNPLRDPFLADLNHRLQAVGEALAGVSSEIPSMWS